MRDGGPLVIKTPFLRGSRLQWARVVKSGNSKKYAYDRCRPGLDRVVDSDTTGGCSPSVVAGLAKKNRYKFAKVE